MNTELLKDFVRLTEEKRDLESELNRTKESLAAIEADVLTEFATDGVDKVTVSGMTLSVRRQLWAGTVDGDHAKACAALVESGYSEYVEERFNTNKLSALVRELDAEGMKLPPEWEDAIAVTEKFSVGAVKASRK